MGRSQEHVCALLGALLAVSILFVAVQYKSNIELQYRLNYKKNKKKIGGFMIANFLEDLRSQCIPKSSLKHILCAASQRC